MPQIHDLPPEEDNNINASAGDSNDHEIEYELQSLIEALPEEKQGEFQALLLQVERTSWKGFLPPPEILLAYNDAISNGAERILQMAEKRASHKMELQMKIIPGNLSQNKWGQIYAFIIAMSFLLTAGILIWHGHETSGTILGSINIIALASLFIYGKREQSGVTSKGISSVVLA